MTRKTPYNSTYKKLAVKLIKSALPNSFVYFRPKDIVSGDFYWLNQLDDKVLIAAIDCTGHGVPGALVSVVGANGLNRCVKEFNLSKPAEIFDKLTDLVKETFETDEDTVKDGMDGALCSVDFKHKIVEYAGANNPFWLLRANGEDMEEIKADKQPIGEFDHRKPFTNHRLQLEDGDTFYIFSDGYVDQFGGPKGKKLKYKALKELLVKNRDLSMPEQIHLIDLAFKAWQGNLEQLDDVCIIGVRV